MIAKPLVPKEKISELLFLTAFDFAVTQSVGLMVVAFHTQTLTIQSRRQL